MSKTAPQAVPPTGQPEKREHARIAMQLSGKLFVPAEETTLECQVVNLSGGGAGLCCDEPPPLQTFVVLYIERFGRFEGVTAHFQPGELGVRFVFREAKRQRLLQDIAQFVSGGALDITRLRRHGRLQSVATGFFARADGTREACDILDISLQGMSLRTLSRPPVGEIVRLGCSCGRVVRHHNDGIGVHFLSPIEASALYGG